MNCQLCDKSLSGGIDTFGEVGAELCLGCYFGVSDAALERQADALRQREIEDEKRELRNRIASLNSEIYELRSDIEELQGDLAIAEEEREQLTDQLEELTGELPSQGLRVPETIVNRKLQAWTLAIGGAA